MQSPCGAEAEHIHISHLHMGAAAAAAAATTANEMMPAGRELTVYPATRIILATTQGNPILQ
jgi:hypothetical protein